MTPPFFFYEIIHKLGPTHTSQIVKIHAFLISPGLLPLYTIPYLRFPRFLRTSGIWGAWCKADYYAVRWHESIRTTPRGAQDKQPLAPTWRESPWTSADYKTGHNNIERSVLYESSAEQHLRSVTRKLLYECNKRIIRLVSTLTTPDITSSNRGIPLRSGIPDTAVLNVL